MPLTIKTTREIGFCFGVKRAIRMLQLATAENREIDALGSLVHNEQVLDDLKSKGIRFVSSPVEIKRNIVAISAHGVSPSIELELAAKNMTLIDTTCPEVKRAQKVSQKLAQNGFWVVIFGDAEHPEVEGILGWADGKGIVAKSIDGLKNFVGLHKYLGLISQTTQTPENYTSFAQDLIRSGLADAAEIRIINTICPGVRRRQSEASELAQKSDLMLIIGSHTSANSRRLYEICNSRTEAHLINTAAEIDVFWLKGKKSIGVTSGTSTSQETLDKVIESLNNLGR